MKRRKEVKSRGVKQQQRQFLSGKKAEVSLRLQAGQQVRFVWMHENVPCPFVGLNQEKLVKSYADYCLIDIDLNFTGQLYSEIAMVEHQKNSRFRQFAFAMAVVSYGRSFTQGEGRAAILDPNEVFRNSPSMRETAPGRKKWAG